MRAFIARLKRWFADRAARRRMTEAHARGHRDGFDHRHEEISDRIMVLALLGCVLLASIGVNVIGMAAKASSLLGAG